MILAPGATPAMGCIPATPLPSPAAIPATCVPWSHNGPRLALLQAGSESTSALSSVVRPLGHSDCWVPPMGCDEQYCATTRPPRNGWSTSTPVSRIATVVPAPVYPAVCAASARMTCRLLSSATFWGTSTCTATTCGEWRTRASAAVGTVATRCGERVMVRVTVPTASTEAATDRVLERAS